MLVVLAAGLAAHSLLLFTDFIIWDGWWLVQELRFGRRYDLLLSYAQEFGRPLDYVYWRLLGLFPRPEIAVKWLAVIAWITSALFIYQFWRRSARLKPVVACFIAVSFVVFPAYKMMGEAILFMNTTSVAIFWFGWFLHERSVSSRSAWLRICAVLAFAASFNLNSLLVYFYAVVFTLVLFQSRGVGFSEVWQCALRKARAFPELVVLPVVFYAAKGWLTPAHGQHANYNKPSFDPELLVGGSAHAWNHLLRAEAVSWLENPAILAVVALVVLTVLLKGWSGRWTLGYAPQAPFGLIAFCGASLFVAAALPYIVVGQNLANDGWLSRNSILAGMPVGMMVVGGLGWLDTRLLKSSGRVWTSVASAFALLCIIASNRNVLELSAFAAKQESIRFKLNEEVLVDSPSVVQIRDFFWIPGTIAYYPPVIWTYLAAFGKPLPSTFLIDVNAVAPPQVTVEADGSRRLLLPELHIDSGTLVRLMEQTTMSSMLGGVPLQGGQRLLIIEEGSLGANGSRLGVMYLWRKLFASDGLPDFLQAITKVNKLDLAPVQPVGKAGG